MPIEVFGKTFPDWAAAHAHVMAQGYSSDQADRIVGKAKSEQESVKETIEILHNIINNRTQESSYMDRGCLTKLAGLPKEEAYKEAQKILETVKASPLVRYTVGLALRMTDDHEKKVALEEAEKTMYTEDEAKKRETEEEAKKEIASTGTSTQSTSTTDVAAGVDNRLGGKHVGDAKTEKGTNQSNRADHVVETDSEFDMGSCVVKAVGDGMTPEEARKHCQGKQETHMRETVNMLRQKNKVLETEIIPAFKEALKSIDARLQEAIKPKGVITLERPTGGLTLGARTQETSGPAVPVKTSDMDTMRKEIKNYDNFLDSSRT